MCLEIRQVVKSYRGATPVLDGISLTVQSGDVIGITGSSGIGKTTLGLIMAGILKPDRGRILFNNKDLWKAKSKSRKSITQKLQMVFQHPESSFDPRWTIGQSLAEPYRLKGIHPDSSLLEDHLKQVELDGSLLPRRPHQLSGGELQRIAIARVMVLKPAVLILDEPTAMLDVLTQARIMALLKRFQTNTDTGYVLISHEHELVRRFCNKIFQLNRGRLVISDG